MLKKLNLPFEIKALGYSFYLPILLQIIFLFQMVLLDNKLNFILLKEMEFLVVPFSAWWIIFLYYDYFEEDGNTVLFTYPLTIFQHGILRVSIFTLLYEILLIIDCLILNLIHYKNYFFNLLLPYLFQSLLYIAIAFFIVLFSKKVMVPIIVIGGYVSTEYLTGGNIIPFFHIITFNIEPITFRESEYGLILNFSLSFFLFFISHILLKWTINKRLLK
ncbi:hypothetical protein [Niallia sp. 01092]|uniref:hypothetical protein n=1 Tax=unclassified Niallia TaxID=2837522 RepID=UPI003FD5B333